jgi:hypothetical protein
MTIAATPSTPVPINTLILLAYKRAGLLPVEATTAGANMPAKLAHAKSLLDVILDNLAVEGFVARTMAFYDLDLVAGTSTYTLTDTILDVHEDAMSFTDAEPTVELVCQQIDFATYQTLTTKTSESPRPQLYVALRSGATVEVRLWPVPSEAGTLRLKSVRLLGNNQTGTDTPDLQRYWLDALVWMLAYYVAVDSSLPLDRCQFLGSQAEAKKQACIRYGMEHTPIVAQYGYTTQWSP